MIEPEDVDIVEDTAHHVAVDQLEQCFFLHPVVYGIFGGELEGLIVCASMFGNRVPLFIYGLLGGETVGCDTSVGY